MLLLGGEVYKFRMRIQSRPATLLEISSRRAGRRAEGQAGWLLHVKGGLATTHRGSHSNRAVDNESLFGVKSGSQETPQIPQSTGRPGRSSGDGTGILSQLILSCGCTEPQLFLALLKAKSRNSKYFSFTLLALFPLLTKQTASFSARKFQQPSVCGVISYL